ncbi:serine hydrolase [Mycolicibacterium phlei]
MTVACVVAVAGCAGTTETDAPADGAYGVPIELNTPQGVRAKQTMDMLNSDWPIGTESVSTLAVPKKVDEVTAILDSIWWDRPFTVTDVEIGAGKAKLGVLTSYGVAQQIELRVDPTDAALVDEFDVSLRPPTITNWSDIDAELTKSGARYSYQVSKVAPDNSRCDVVAGTNTDLSLPLASIFKLYVLLAVADAVKAGTLSWDDHLTITREAKALGSANLDKLPAGAMITVRTAAQQMISASDNMTTDLLINRLGVQAVEKALVDAGHHDPASMTPFPTMHALFAVGWGRPDLREQWREAVEKGTPQDRAQLLKQASSHPYEPDPERTHTPASTYGAEWYGSAADICRVHLALQRAAVGPAAPVREILSAIPGIDLDRAKWPYIGAKGGNLPGDLTFSWYAVDDTGQPWVVSFQLNWPTFRSRTAATWLLSIVEQAFALIPTQH